MRCWFPKPYVLHIQLGHPKGSEEDTLPQDGLQWEYRAHPRLLCPEESRPSSKEMTALCSTTQLGGFQGRKTGPFSIFPHLPLIILQQRVYRARVFHLVSETTALVTNGDWQPQEKRTVGQSSPTFFTVRWASIPVKSLVPGEQGSFVTHNWQREMVFWLDQYFSIKKW